MCRPGLDHCNNILKSITALGGKQALWDTLEAGQEKKGELAATSLEFEYIWIKKVDVKC